jgi:hypothetical protein
MKDEHRVNRFDPTDRPTADQSTPGAAGLGAGQPSDDEIVARDPRSRGTAPRRYEVEEDEREPSDAPRRKSPA